MNELDGCRLNEIKGNLVLELVMRKMPRVWLLVRANVFVRAIALLGKSLDTQVQIK